MSAHSIPTLHLRRERIILPIWLAGLTLLLTAAGAAISREFGDERERAALAAVAAGNPAFLFLRGLPDGTGVGALVFFQTFAFLAVLIGLMNAFLIVRHTRADEERGRSELLQATPISRTAPLTSALTVALLADLVAAAAVTAAGMLLGFAAWPALLFGLALGCVGLAFAGLSAVAAEVMPTSRSANGLAASLVGVAYITRGIGDALGTADSLDSVSPSWISFLSPIGSAQAAAPFSTATPLPLLVPALLGAAGAAAAVLLRRRRDLGQSLLPDRTGRALWSNADAWRLAIRSQRGVTTGWAIGTAVLGGLAAALAPVVLAAAQANDDLAALIRRLAPGLAVETADLFTVALLGIAGTLATASGVQAVMRLRAEESEGRAELLLPSPLPRSAWMGIQLAVAAGSAIIVALAAGVAAGVGSALVEGTTERLLIPLAAVLVHLPAGAVFLALTAAAFAFVPRLTVALGWGLLVLGLVVGQLGDLIGLPSWLQAASPFHHVPAIPMEALDPAPLLISLAAAALVAGAAVVQLDRRDLVS
ncbi:polyketide antibiotic transporter [Naasia sp. SYSU D00057]|uniref:polyketide antibiotic transporter n=1 Tax=Naasia sp. SYSU D00057 TaxID=2817380 RepID=UPI001B300E20|nr:polyketide antibiotic transporter [Naasia sp. SYSU D00057]